jgi:DNA-binding HxlR family transcriptional regulator
MSIQTEIKTEMCPRYEKAVGILGKRWTGLIIKVLLGGPARFNQIHAVIKQVSDRVLTERLRELEAEGLVERSVYPESPVRIEYSLTSKGRALEPVINAIGHWAEEWVETEHTNDLHAYETKIS